MTSRAAIRDILNDIPLFAGCSGETLDRIAAISGERHVAKGALIYAEGDQAPEMFVLVKGLVSFTTPGGAGAGVGLLHVETLMKRYMIFGWAALVPEHPRRLGSARCLEDSELIAINGDDLLEILERDPASGLRVMTRLCSMIASTFIRKT